MATILWLLAGFFVVSLVVTILFFKKAPAGFQDKSGFHLGHKEDANSAEGSANSKASELPATEDSAEHPPRRVANG